MRLVACRPSATILTATRMQPTRQMVTHPSSPGGRKCQPFEGTHDVKAAPRSGTPSLWPCCLASPSDSDLVEVGIYTRAIKPCVLVQNLVLEETERQCRSLGFSHSSSKHGWLVVLVLWAVGSFLHPSPSHAMPCRILCSYVVPMPNLIGPAEAHGMHDIPPNVQMPRPAPMSHTVIAASLPRYNPVIPSQPFQPVSACRAFLFQRCPSRLLDCGVILI